MMVWKRTEVSKCRKGIEPDMNREKRKRKKSRREERGSIGKVRR